VVVPVRFGFLLSKQRGCHSHWSEADDDRCSQRRCLKRPGEGKVGGLHFKNMMPLQGGEKSNEDLEKNQNSWPWPVGMWSAEGWRVRSWRLGGKGKVANVLHFPGGKAVREFSVLNGRGVPEEERVARRVVKGARRKMPLKIAPKAALIPGGYDRALTAEGKKRDRRGKKG